MLEVLGRRSSNNVQKVTWLLDERAIPFQQKDFGGPFGKTGTADYLQLNPHGTVTTLIDGGFCLWESNTILRYLAAKLDALYHPAHLQEHAAVDKWLEWQLVTV
jgi:glutathione S-transferase